MDFLFLFGVPFIVLGMIALLIAGKDFKQKSRGFAAMAVGTILLSIFYLNLGSFDNFKFSGLGALYFIFFAIFNYVKYLKSRKSND
ncbi:hypothetical protein IID20_02750 [Patescibacteria group bacterium]|nr:hypothetical protein [Patescibacteria group bacterium]